MVDGAVFFDVDAMGSERGGDRRAETLLHHERVQQRIQQIDSLVSELSGAKSTAEQAGLFADSALASELQRYHEQNSEIGAEDTENVQKLSEYLNENPQVFIAIFQDLAFTVADFLRSRVSEQTLMLEVEHIHDVVANCARVFPNEPVLQLIAAVHDIYKYSSPDPEGAEKFGTAQLGLHEFMSTVLGGEVLAAALEKHDVSSEQVESATLVARRAILTHGKGEFPEVTAEQLAQGERYAIDSNDSFQNENEAPYLQPLFGSLYVHTPLKAVPKHSVTEANEVERIIAGMNALDAITGTTLHYS